MGAGSTTGVGNTGVAHARTWLFVPGNRPDRFADIDAEGTDDSLQMARSTLVLASRVTGKPAPIDGVTAVLDDTGVLARAATRARQLGFGGKLCVHPAPLGPVAAAFRPSRAQTEWAEQILRVAETDASGAWSFDGHLVDKPVLERARRILDEAGQVIDSERIADTSAP